MNITHEFLTFLLLALAFLGSLAHLALVLLEIWQHLHH